MTAQEFHKILEKYRYLYTYEDNITTITHNDNVFLTSLKELPDNIIFNNSGLVNLCSLKKLPDNIIFNNSGYVNLYSLKVLPDNIIFSNVGGVYLQSLKELPNNISFNNSGNVYLHSLKCFNEDFKDINKIIVNEKEVFAIISEYDKLINYLFDAYNVHYISKIKNRYYVYTK